MERASRCLWATIAWIRRETENMLNQPSTGITATTTFIVRFWREWTGSNSRWRGRVEHVQSGQQVSFLKIDDLLGFFERFGIGGEDPPANASENG